MPQGQPPQRYTQYPQPPYPKPGTDMMPSPKPRKKRWYRNWMIISVIVLILLVTAGAYTRYKITTSTNTAVATAHLTKPRTTATSKHPTVTSTPSTATSTSSTVTPTATYVTFGDGTYQVGRDIKSGKYRTRKGSSGCHYTRLGDIGAVIAENTTNAPAIIDIQPTDKEFKTQKCGTWTTDLSPITDNQTPFGDGMYFVGQDKDIQPGTYKNTGGSGCSYARLSGFGGTPAETITSKKTDKPTTVTISSKDVGFQSQGCGTWTKQSQQ